MTHHVSVLLNEVVAALDSKKGRVVVDGTLGGGGHTLALLKKLGITDTLIGIDRDQDALVRFAEIVQQLPTKPKPTVHLVHGNFTDLSRILESLKISYVDHIILDLGWSMDQFTDPKRGFSFMVDGPLDMRLDNPSDNECAADIVNSWSEKDLSDLFWNLSDEKKSRHIAKMITTRRKKKRFETTLDLADEIVKVVGKTGKTHPATKVFQALRIQVNHELSDLTQGICDLFNILKKGGKLQIITFHSGEDRIVKNSFKEFVANKKGELVPKKAQEPTREEVLKNPRSRSSRLRTLVKLSDL